MQWLRDADAQAPLLAAVTLAESVTVQSSGLGYKPKDERVTGVAQARFQIKRARTGRVVQWRQEVLRLVGRPVEGS